MGGWNFEREAYIPEEVRALPRLISRSGRHDPESFAPESNSVLLAFNSDQSTQAPGGFKLTWRITSVQPPDTPAAPEVRETPTRPVNWNCMVLVRSTHELM